MPTTAYSPKRLIRIPSLTDAADIEAGLANTVADLDDVTYQYSGLLSARPAPTSAAGHAAGNPGSEYFATDTNQLFKSLGGLWLEIPISASGAAPVNQADIGDAQVTSRKAALTSGNGDVLSGTVSGAGEFSIASFGVTPLVASVLLLKSEIKFMGFNSTYTGNAQPYGRLYLDGVLQRNYYRLNNGGQVFVNDTAFDRLLLSAAAHTIAFNFVSAGNTQGDTRMNVNYQWWIHAQ